MKISIKNARQFANLTQEVASKKANISKTHLSDIDTGKTIPTLSVFRRLCDVYGVEDERDIFLPCDLTKSKNTKLRHKPRVRKTKKSYSTIGD